MKHPENVDYTVLQNIDLPRDLRALNLAELNTLAGEIRNLIVNTVAATGGHLASSLGAVELTLQIVLRFDMVVPRTVSAIRHRASRYDPRHILGGPVVLEPLQATEEEERQARVRLEADGEDAEAMVREVAANYPSAGFFFDCIYTQPCVGIECLEDMRERGVDWTDEAQLHDYNIQKHVRMIRRLADAAREINPELLIYCNGLGYEAQEEIGNYLEFECLPTGGWGYESLPMGARHLRTLGKPVLNMTGRFHKSWGDFGGIRTEPSLEYDCLYGMANAMRTTIGDHFHPRGDINQPVFDLYRRIYSRLQRYEPWLEGAKAVTEAAVVWPAAYPGYEWRAPSRWETFTRFLSSIKGATRALCELKWQFDLVTTYPDWSGYELLILPDWVALEVIVDKRIVRDIVPELKRAGAEGIIEYPLNKLIY